MIPRIPALAGTLLAAIAATTTATAASAPPARELSCIYAATFQGVPHVGVGSIPGTNLGRAAGPGTIPGCNDFAILPPAPPVPPEPDRVVTFFRIRGVAPRFGVADGARSGSAAMVIPQGSPCLRPPNGRRIVRCLRELTARYLRGPSLVTYPSAAAGSVIQVGVHVRDPGVRRRVGYGVELCVVDQVVLPKHGVVGVMHVGLQPEHILRAHRVMQVVVSNWLSLLVQQRIASCPLRDRQCSGPREKQVTILDMQAFRYFSARISWRFG